MGFQPLSAPNRSPSHGRFGVARNYAARMRFVLYNIRYGTGTGWNYHLPLPFSGYLRPSQKNLDRISAFLRSVNPDIIGLVEVDSGSYRSGKTNQAEVIANNLGFTHVYRSKYAARSVAQDIPLLKEQGNAFLTNQNIMAQEFHYFEKGMKRLVIELEFDNYVIFLVHLSLKYRHRQYQLSDLHDMLATVKKPMIVAGDFNAFWGGRELNLFLSASRLINANKEGKPTYPIQMPHRQFDFILHSPEIQVANFRIPRVDFSDHMPLVCDFEVGTG